MREEFEAAWYGKGWGHSHEIAAWEAWKLAYVAGMTRAAEICATEFNQGWHEPSEASQCASYIRAEITKDEA